MSSPVNLSSLRDLSVIYWKEWTSESVEKAIQFIKPLKESDSSKLFQFVYHHFVTKNLLSEAEKCAEACASLQTKSALLLAIFKRKINSDPVFKKYQEGHLHYQKLALLIPDNLLRDIALQTLAIKIANCHDFCSAETIVPMITRNDIRQDVSSEIVKKQQESMLQGPAVEQVNTSTT